MKLSSNLFFFFFFNDTATTEIYTLSLHDALPISTWPSLGIAEWIPPMQIYDATDRKSTRLNSSHDQISYAVFCLKKNRRRSCDRPGKRNGHPIKPPAQPAPSV